tara:strand:+ start:315 stop:1019 length:705 start_codon:yes stop_codon:yes gene_type:complete
MPKRKEILTDKIRPYHIIGKAVEGRGIFEKEEDKARFVFQMYAANVGKPVINLYRKDIFKVAQAILQGEEIPNDYFVREHQPLVQLFSYVLAKDRYHLGMVPMQKDSIPQYMQKLNLGFAKYYNLKYKRSGALFEGRFHAASISSPTQLNTVVRYINIKKVRDVFENVSENWNFLKEYSYSSFPDLFGSRASHLLSKESRDTLKKFLGDEFFQVKQDYTEDIEDLEEGQGLFLN